MLSSDGQFTLRGRGVDGDALLDRVAAEPSAGSGDEQRIGWSSGSFGQPGGEDGPGWDGERNGAFLPAFALATHVRAGPELDVSRVERDQLRHAQTGLNREDQHRPVATALPAGLVGRVDQRLALAGREERDLPLLVTLRRDRQHLRDHARVLGVPQGRVFEQRSDRGKPQVPGPGGVVTLGLEMFEKRGDDGLVEVVPVELGGLLAGALLGEAQQQSERVAVGRDRSRAGLQLPGEAVGEERLQGRRDRGHDRTAWASLSRRAACASRSGAADR